MQARIDPTRLRYFRTRLRRWFGEYGRDLPWRRTRDPYRILVSEIMLQQTQAPRVAEVYTEFLERFPTIDDVADARLRDVKKITDPLGYKVRGKWIKQIADEVVTYRAGQVPDSVDELMELPGVGRYTAGAIMTFAHGLPTPILDTNVARVLSRWFAGALPVDEPEGRRERRLWALAAAVLPNGDGWTINQGLMDFGAQVCVARTPLCADCPVRRRCHYPRQDGGAAERGIVQWRESERR
ncbi:MAG: A/G-specific adenine glycosylase [Dehalococcoidia bacterium]